MLRPTPEEVLNSISYTFDKLIRPDPTSALAASYSLTVSNMLRQLQLSLKHEETAIADDVADLRATLGIAQAYLQAGDRDAEWASAIGEALAASPGGPAIARASRDNWRALRGVLERTIYRLQDLRGAHGDEAEYRAVRQAVRDYLDRSLERERILIDGAFTLARR